MRSAEIVRHFATARKIGDLTAEVEPILMKSAYEFEKILGTDLTQKQISNDSLTGSTIYALAHAATPLNSAKKSTQSCGHWKP